MKGYGYSLWIVPITKDIIRGLYMMKHIPHVTISTNHEVIPDKSQYNKYYCIGNFGDIVNIPKQYKVDPLYSVGWMCDVSNLVLPHRPHMSMKYGLGDYPEFNKNINSPYNVMGEVMVADTRSLNPSDWTLLS